MRHGATTGSNLVIGPVDRRTEIVFAHETFYQRRRRREKNAVPFPYSLVMALVAKVLTVSDSVYAHIRDDTATPLLVARLELAGFTVIERRLCPDGVEIVASALRELCDGFSGLVVTTGGTGFSPRDLTPEATAQVLEREAPGLGEAMRATSPLGALSRSRAGTVGRVLVLNTPGSPRGAVESLEAVLEILPHALELLDQGQSEHPPETGGRTTTSS